MGFGGAGPDVKAAPGAVAKVDSAGFDGAPKPNPPDAGLEPKRPLDVLDEPGAGAAVVAGFPKLKPDFAVSSAGLAPNNVAPPVLAPNVELGGGAPAGVVEGLLKLKGLLPPIAGVVEPNNGCADAERVDGLSGVPNPGKTDFGASLL